MKQSSLALLSALALGSWSFAQVTRPVPDQVSGRVSEQAPLNSSANSLTPSAVTPTAPVTEPPFESVENMPPRQPVPLEFNLFDTYQTYPPYEDSRMTGSSTTNTNELQRPDLQETQRTQVSPNLAPGVDSVTTTTVPRRQ
jgi:hypothetical protein